MCIFGNDRTAYDAWFSVFTGAGIWAMIPLAGRSAMLSPYEVFIEQRTMRSICTIRYERIATPPFSFSFARGQ